MKLSPKTLNWLMISGVIVILLVLLYILFSGKLNPTRSISKTKINEPTATTSVTGEPIPQVFSIEPLDNDQTPLDDRGRLEIQLEKKAGAFVERWASMSSQDNFSNLEILKNGMTKTMVAWTTKYIQEESANKNNNVYTGIQAQAIVTQGVLADINTNSITIKVKIRGQETTGQPAGQPQTFYQDYQLTLIKNGSDWLADKITWQERQNQ